MTTPNTSVHPTVAVIGGTGRRVADRLLTAADPSAETLELTGPRLLTFAGAAVDAGVDREEAEALGVVFEQIFDGRNAYTTNTVDRVLGRPAGDFAAYVRRAAASGTWSLEESPAEMPA